MRPAKGMGSPRSGTRNYNQKFNQKSIKLTNDKSCVVILLKFYIPIFANSSSDKKDT